MKRIPKKTSAKRRTPPAAPKMSEILKEMSEKILNRGDDAPAEARQIALLLAYHAWNQAIGYPCKLDHRFKKEIADAKRTLPTLWSEFIHSDYEMLINMLALYKMGTYPDDERFVVGIQLANDDRYEEGGRIRVAFIPKSNQDAFFKLSDKKQQAMIAEMLNG